MDVPAYFRSLGDEIDALKQRVRQIIRGRHWQTDGEWKESVVRQILRRHLPANAIVGRGFVVNANNHTTQLDVLVYKASAPVLFRDGDLVFVTPDAVVGIVEVKSRVTAAVFDDAVEKLADAAELIRVAPNSEAFSALFAFEAEEQPQRYLERTKAAAGNSNRGLSFASLGRDRFIRYWELDPLNGRRFYESWHSYRFDNLSHGYFVHNVVDAVSPQSVFSNRQVWFPDGGKEPFRDGAIRSQWGDRNEVARNAT